MLRYLYSTAVVDIQKSQSALQGYLGKAIASAILDKSLEKLDLWLTSKDLALRETFILGQANLEDYTVKYRIQKLQEQWPCFEAAIEALVEENIFPAEIFVKDIFATHQFTKDEYCLILSEILIYIAVLACGKEIDAVQTYLSYIIFASFRCENIDTAEDISTRFIELLGQIHQHKEDEEDQLQKVNESVLRIHEHTPLHLMADHLRDILYSWRLDEACALLDRVIKRNPEMKIAYPDVSAGFRAKDYLLGSTLYRYLRRGYILTVLNHPYCTLTTIEQEWKKERVRLLWKPLLH